MTSKQEFFPIASVAREDLEGIGFDTGGIGDEDMRDLASKMADAYCEQIFWIDLEIMATECLKIPRKREGVAHKQETVLSRPNS